MFYADRFFIGSLAGLAALTYYNVPFDLAARLWIISTSLTMTLFPAFSILESRRDAARIASLYLKAIKYLTLISGTAACLMVGFSREILMMWVGPDFAMKSTLVLRVLLISTLFDAPAVIASSLLEGTGQPKRLALVKLIYLPVHLALCAALTELYGIVGAVFALFALRLIYSIAFGAASLRTVGLSKLEFARKLGGTFACMGGLLIVMAAISYVPVGYRLAGAGAVGVILSAVLWKHLIDETEKESLRRILKDRTWGRSRG